MKKIISRIKYWFYYRFHPQHKYNIVKTGLKPGYYDIDELILHANFSLLRRYVENELAHLHRICFPEENIKDKKERGLRYLSEELTAEDDSDQDYISEKNSIDKEVKELYLWWDRIRPARKDVWDKLSLDFPDVNYDFKNGLKLISPSKEREDEYRAASKIAFKEDGRRYEEDTEMLVRLMKVRSSLWT